MPPESGLIRVPGRVIQQKRGKSEEEATRGTNDGCGNARIHTARGIYNPKQGDYDKDYTQKRPPSTEPPSRTQLYNMHGRRSKIQAGRWVAATQLAPVVS